MELDPPEYIDPRELPPVFDALAWRNRQNKERHFNKRNRARLNRSRATRRGGA